MPAIIDQAGRPFNVDEADAISRRHRRLLRAVDEFLAHYHKERNHQGLGNALIVAQVDASCGPRVRCRERLGGLLRYYHHAA
jgi:putative transposase